MLIRDPNPNLYRTNVLPSDEEANEVRQHLCALEVELRSVELEIVVLVNRAIHQTNGCKIVLEIAVLLAKRTGIIEQMNRRKIILAPHRKLPPELVRSIFLFFIIHFYRGRVEKGSARGIFHVCSAWRRIAVTTSQLWELLFTGVKSNHWRPRTLVRGSRVPAKRGPPRRKVKLVPQSGLLLKLSNRGETSSSQERIEHAVDHCLIPNSHRIRQLELSVPYQYINQILALPSGTFPELETLTVRDFTGEFVGSAPSADILTASPGSAFMLTPYVRSASFWFMDDISLRRLKFPWSQLTDLILIGKRYQLVADVCLMVLSNCTSLVRCHFSSISFSDGVISPIITTLPHLPVTSLTLQSLVLDFAEPGKEIGTFLQSLVFPSLQKLVLSRIGDPDCLPAFDWFGFLQPMSLTLETLQIIDIRCPPWDIGSLLACIPHVKKVLLSADCFLSRSTMKKIACGSLLPCIEDFTFPARRLSFALKMLKSRQALAFQKNDRLAKSIFSHLHAIKIFVSFDVSFDVDSDQSNLEMEGMEITLEMNNQDTPKYNFPLTPAQMK